MESHWRSVLWGQFGAAIDMLENALLACPGELWSDRSRRPEFGGRARDRPEARPSSTAAREAAPPGPAPAGLSNPQRRRPISSVRASIAERHFHAAQLNLILRQTVDAAPRWVARTES